MQHADTGGIMSKKKGNEEAVFSFRENGFAFAAAAADVYDSQPSYRGSAAVMADEFLKASMEAGKQVALIQSVPDRCKAQSAGPALDAMDNAIYIAILMSQLGVWGAKLLNDYIVIGKSIKNNLLPLINGVEVEEDGTVDYDEDGFYEAGFYDDIYPAQN